MEKTETPPAKFVFHGPNKGLMKYLHETDQVLVVDNLGGGEFSNLNFIDKADFEKFQKELWADTDGEVTLVEVVLS